MQTRAELRLLVLGDIPTISGTVPPDHVDELLGVLDGLGSSASRRGLRSARRVMRTLEGGG